MKFSLSQASLLLLLQGSIAFVPSCPPRARSPHLNVYTPEQAEDDKETSAKVLESLVEKLDKSASPAPKKKDNKAMAFLRKMGKVGGAANKDFANATGSDEGAGMAAPKSDASSASIKKSILSYKSCVDTGVIDDMSDAFPLTSSGSEWRGVSDRVRGGMSEGAIQREDVDGKPANVLKGHVKLQDGKGFLQMVTDLPMDASKKSVDASAYDGIELEIKSMENPQFNIHLRTPGSLQQESYRHTVNLEVLMGWETIRIPFDAFLSESGNVVDYSQLQRIGIVALDQETDVELAVRGVRFYSVF